MFCNFRTMKNYFLLFIFLNSFLGNAICQDTLSVDWHRNVCSNNFIDNVFDIKSDSNGNVFTLGGFPISTNSLGQILNESTGSYFLNKLDSLGNLIYSINFGNQDYLTFGKLELTNSNEIILGLNFKGDFYFDNNIITSNTNWSSILFKLDSNLNLLWYKKIPCVKQAISPNYINALIQDENQNIYASIQYIDSIEINGTIYTKESNSYGFLISKFDSNGNALWTRNYQADQTLVNRNLTYFRKGDQVGTLIMSGQNLGDSLFVDGAIQLIENGLGTFVSKLDENGNILESVHYKNVDNITNFSFYNDRIFCAGIFRDTVFWVGNFSIPIENKSAFICELNQFSDIIEFNDLYTSENVYLTDFAISELYGFVVSGIFSGGMNVQTSSITLQDQYNYGSFIASFDHNFDLNDSKYITGGIYKLFYININSNIIFGTGTFQNYCDFENVNLHATNDNISVFRTSDMHEMLDFNSQLSAIEMSGNNCNILIYPNPSSDILNIYTESLLVLNVMSIDGKIVIDFIDAKDESNNLIDISELKSGIYFINLLDCNENLKSIRIEKN